MDPREIFSQWRMERCARIQRAILDNWQKSASSPSVISPYTVRATDRLAGLSLSELRLQYFAVGAGDELTDLPFHDMLVVFVMLEQTTAAMRRLDRNTSDGTIEFRFDTVFPDQEVLRLLSKIRIETPFDPDPYLKRPAVD